MPEAGRRILVAEDNDVNYTLVKFVLDKAGYEVLRAGTGDQALECARSQRPDLILMDIQLPGIDGMEVTRRLKADAQTSSVPVVALTALAMSGDEQRVLAAGCDGYLTKPVSPRDLVATAERFLKSEKVDRGAA